MINIAKYKKYTFKEKTTKYACIIATLNENERFLKQMDKMKKHNIFELCDIIICDGNSSDNTSSNPDIVKSYGARMLLINEDSNRKGQGVQLKQGFYECISEKYAGVIMCDGNNKDNIETALPLFIQKLEESYDVVQSTRYRLQGKGINTPLLRELAIRFIASPLISLSSGLFISDPCNGFKAFSYRYMTDSRMDWLGDFYQKYEYCYYPLVRVKKLNYKYTEVPTIRTYPKGEIPSKIIGIKSHFNLLKSIISICLTKNLD